MYRSRLLAKGWVLTESYNRRFRKPARSPDNNIQVVTRGTNIVNARTAVWVGLAVLVVASLGIAGTAATTQDQVIGIDTLPPDNQSDTTRSQSTAAEESDYVVVAATPGDINRTELARYGTVGSQVETQIELTTTEAEIRQVENLSWVTATRPAMRSRPVTVPGSSNGTSLGVEPLHQQGTTGSGVKVGVIDQGFDPDNAAIASNVVEVRSFGDVTTSGAHGTSVAEVVVRTAPDSQLYLASGETLVDDQRAIEYLVQRDVDVIVYAQGYPQIADDGRHSLSNSIQTARESGILFVSSAGNYAQTHWQGSFRDGDGDTIHEWTARGSEANIFPDTTAEFSGPVEIFLRWRDVGENSEYRLALYNPDTESYIAYRNERGETRTNQFVRLATTVDPQRAGLVIQNTAGPPDDELEVVISSTAPQSITYSTPQSSLIVPADSPDATTTAAYEVGSRRIAPYSSQGPTNDGRRGLITTGYTNIGVDNGLYSTGTYAFAGTSSSAPYVAGVAALVIETRSGGRSPATVERLLVKSSDDILEPGNDTVSGAGVVNASRAVELATPSVTISNASVTPATASANTTVTHELSYEVNNLRPEDAPHKLTVTLPAGSSFNTTAAGLSVVDESGLPLTTGGKVTLSDVDAGSNNRLSFQLAPDSDRTVDTAIVSLDVEITHGTVAESTETPIELGVLGEEQPVATRSVSVTVQPASAGARPDTLPEPVSTAAFEAVDTDGNRRLSPSEIALAINENAARGAVGGTTVQPSEFALMITWNSEQ